MTQNFREPLDSLTFGTTNLVVRVATRRKKLKLFTVDPFDMASTTGLQTEIQPNKADMTVNNAVEFQHDAMLKDTAETMNMEESNTDRITTNVETSYGHDLNQTANQLQQRKLSEEKLAYCHVANTRFMTQFKSTMWRIRKQGRPRYVALRMKRKKSSLILRKMQSKSTVDGSHNQRWKTCISREKA
jgi:hypothetical protein